MKGQLVLISLLLCLALHGQNQVKRALFLGNSYTAVNNLPQMVADAALSAGDTLIFDSNTPGGYTLEGHSTNETSLDKIKAGDWDYVVLQEQSQRPSLPIEQVMTDVFPYAHILDSIITIFNPCGETVFYMTWGRKNGDASNCDVWPPVCTYEGMDSLLNLRYRMMADSNKAILSAVGAVWHCIRQNYPAIELYQADESHPSVAGSYAAACCFYASLFRKDPAQITFNPSLPDSDAAHIRTTAKLIIYDSLMNWHIGEYDPVARFTYQVTGGLQVDFSNGSDNASAYLWDFGDGDTSHLADPVHIYEASGLYEVALTAGKCNTYNTATQLIDVSLAGIMDSPAEQPLSWGIYPVPVAAELTVRKNIAGDLHYKVYSSNGVEIQCGTLNHDEMHISVAALHGGLYFLKLFNTSTSFGQKKFIKD